jgi:hypothetical protein
VVGERDGMGEGLGDQGFARPWGLYAVGWVSMCRAYACMTRCDRMRRHVIEDIL